MRASYKLKKYFSGVLLLLVLLIGASSLAYAVSVPQVQAATTTPPIATDRGSLVSNILGSIVTFSLSGIAFFLMIIGVFVMTICAMILYFAGVIMNLAVNYSILDMSNTVNSIEGINIAWRVFRDLANMSFIFVISYVAISTILGTSGRLSKEIIVRVLVVALLLNFSLFFTKVMVDSSNILAAQFYKAMVPDSTGSVNGGVSWVFMRSMALTTVYSLNQHGNNPLAGPQDITLGQVLKGTYDNITQLDSQSGALVSILGSIFFLIAAFVFFAGGILLIIRFVVLVLLMATSPLAYIAMVIPGAQKYASQWWENLTKHLIFAPAYMMMLWIVLTIINSNQFITGVARTAGQQSQLGSFGAALTNGGSSVSIVLNFIIIIVMLLAAVIIAQTLGIQGTKAAMNFSQNLTGKLATRLTGVQRLNRLARENRLPFSTTSWGKKFAASGTGQYMRQLTQKATGLAADRKFGGYASVNEVQERKKKESQLRIAGGKDIETRAELENAAKAVEEYRKKEAAGTLTKEEREGPMKAALERLQTAAVGLSKAQIDTFSSQILKQQDLVAALNPTQLEWIGESEKFSAAEKSEINKARRAPYEAAAKFIAANGNKTQAELQEVDPQTKKSYEQLLLEARKTVRGITTAELERMPAEFIQQPGFAQGLSYDQASSLYKSSKIAAWQKQAIKDERQKSLTNIEKELKDIEGREQAAWAEGRTISDDDQKRRTQLQLAVQSVAPAEIKEFDSDKVLSNRTFASLFSNEQADEIDKSDLPSNVKDRIREARLARYTNIMNPTTTLDGDGKALAQAHKDLTKMGVKWINRMDIKTLTSDRMMQMYRPPILQRMAQEGLSEEKIAAIKEKIEDIITTPGKTPPPNIKQISDWLTKPESQYRF